MSEIEDAEYEGWPVMKLTDSEKRKLLQKIIDAPRLPGFKRLVWDEDFTHIVSIEEVEPDRGLDLPAKE